ncbi:sensor domain-containing diguanylate cyclase [Paenibacillus cymbidii]|uniref:sensor domain-containing diguanylate cyclase n=1 Tax=Paenibacillus cymbidii TaxID=1639034 RepID=UPI001F3217DB|nr:sensor domain-containing diguanylate cyclase [Paenibacillus cymbidii]
MRDHLRESFSDKEWKSSSPSYNGDYACRITLRSASERDLNAPSDIFEDILRPAFVRWHKTVGIHFPKRTFEFLIGDKSGRLHDEYKGERLQDMTLFIKMNAADFWRDGGLRASVAYAYPKLGAQDKLTVALMPIIADAADTVGFVALVGRLPAGVDPLLLLQMGAVSFVPYVDNRVVALSDKVQTAEHLHLLREEKRRETLFQLSQKLFSMIDVDSVLSELLRQMKDIFPHAEIDLLLSQDNSSNSQHVKPLIFYNQEDDLCTRAFMEGRVIRETDPLAGRTEVAAPLIGKQGVYGVFHLISDGEPFTESPAFIESITRTAGTAFENAKLYEQSNLMISELRLINEITKRLNQSLKLNEIFHFASSELITIFGADFCCILQTDNENKEMIVQGTNLPSMFHDIFAVDYGFAGVVVTSKEPLIISDYWSHPQISSKLMEMTASRSLIASPILVNSEVVGVILVTHRTPNFFSYENYKLLQVLSGHVGLAIANASLHAEVRRMVITDNLTGLYARHYLDEQINYFQKKDFCGSLIVVDIDNFKGVNDTFGHQVGDKILIQVSGIIKSCIRESDIPARWGGEELAVYLPQVSIEQAVRIAERVRERVQTETNPQVTVSCGVSDWNWQDERVSVEMLFYKSDMALYKAKHEGKNQIKIG